MTEKTVPQINYNTEIVEFKKDGASHSIEAPADFLDYFYKFIEFKNLVSCLFSIDQEILQDDPDFIKTLELSKNIHGESLTNWLHAKGYDKTKIPDVIQAAISHYNDFYSLTEFGERGKSKMKSNVTDFDLPFPVRPVFLRYFTMQLWSFLKYLQDLDINLENEQNNLKKVIKTNLAKLVRNTTYTDKTIKMPSNINLDRYDLGNPQKLTGNQMQYGKAFIRLSKSYKILREFWLDLCAINPDAAKYFEYITYVTAKSGYDYYSFKYSTNCGAGGKAKDDLLNEARYKIRDAYNQICPKRISAEQIVNRLLDPQTGIETNEKYNNLKNKPVSSATILKWVKEWDKENGINRKGFPRAKKSIHK